MLEKLLHLLNRHHPRHDGYCFISDFPIVSNPPYVVNALLLHNNTFGLH